MSVADIVGNPKRLRIVELDAAQLPRALDDVTLAKVGLTYLIDSGGDPRLGAFIAAFRSPEVKIYAAREFHGFLEPVW